MAVAGFGLYGAFACSDDSGDAGPLGGGRGGTRSDAGQDSGAGVGATGGSDSAGSAGSLGTGGAAGAAGAAGAGAVGGASGASGSSGASAGGAAGTGDASAGAGGSGGSGGAQGGSGGTSNGGTAGTGTGGSAGSGGSGGSGGGGDRCDVAIHDPANPPRVLALTGALGTHDPTLIEENGVFYEFQTGPTLPGKTSTNLLAWRDAPRAFGANPGWIASQVPEAEDLWAPDLSFFSGQYHLYYSASSFGSRYSCIGHATRASLATGSWTDRGPAVCSNHGSNDDWNAIDPNVIVDQAGTPWLSFGSFWSGIKVIELDQSGARRNDDLHSIASRGGDSIEAPVIVRRCGYYYLFVSFGACCAGVNSTYNIRVGRSQNVLGPYTDKNGTPMMNGGGTLLVQGSARWRGPGHNAVIFSGTRAYNFYHSYDADNGGRPVLRGAELVWDADGWPISGGP